MEASPQSRAGGGLWNNPRSARYSKETRDMLSLMMQESRFTNFQIKHINDCLKNGAPLPLTFDPEPSPPPPRPDTSKSVRGYLSDKPMRRSAECCRSGDSYVREKFCPRPTRNLAEEKRRLQNIFATGHAEPTEAPLKNPTPSLKPEEETDRYQEVLDEIEERRQFLADMASLGRESHYIAMINAEISQRKQELKSLEKTRSPKKDAIPPESKEQTAERTTESESPERGRADTE